MHGHKLNLFGAAPVRSCKTISALAGICSTVGVASTSYLFFLRVRAVYSQSKSITVLFGALWFATVVLSISTNTFQVLGAGQCQCSLTSAPYPTRFLSRTYSVYCILRRNHFQIQLLAEHLNIRARHNSFSSHFLPFGCRLNGRG